MTLIITLRSLRFIVFFFNSRISSIRLHKSLLFLICGDKLSTLVGNTNNDKENYPILV